MSVCVYGYISWPIEIVVFRLSLGLLTLTLVRNMHKMNGIHYTWLLCLSGDDNPARRSCIAIDRLVITADPFIVDSKYKPMSLKYPEIHVSTRGRVELPSKVKMLNLCHT